MALTQNLPPIYPPFPLYLFLSLPFLLFPSLSISFCLSLSLSLLLLHSLSISSCISLSPPSPFPLYLFLSLSLLLLPSLSISFCLSDSHSLILYLSSFILALSPTLLSLYNFSLLSVSLLRGICSMFQTLKNTLN